MRYMLLSVALLSLVSVVVVAQEPITLDLELYQDAALIASPRVEAEEGETGSVRLVDVVNFVFTPTRLNDERIAVAFEIENEDRTLTSRVVFTQEQTASVKWASASGADSRERYEIRMALESEK